MKFLSSLKLHRQPHECRFPTPEAGRAMIWECPRCKTVWSLDPSRFARLPGHPLPWVKLS